MSESNDDIVYFIQAGGDDGPIKIGVTSGDPKDRMRQLQTGSSTPFNLICTLRGGRELEKKLHLLFSNARVRANGEWFYPIAELRMFVAGVSFGRASERRRSVISANVFASAMALFINAIYEYTIAMGQQFPLPRALLAIGTRAFEGGATARAHIDTIGGAEEAGAILDAAMEPIMRRAGK